MRLVLTALIFMGGLAFVLMGLTFLASPAGAIAGLGIDVAGAPGLSTTRADFTAFFLTAGFAMLYGGWKRSGEILLVPAFLFGIALAGRVVSLAVDGTYDGFLLPMAVEAATLLVSLAGWRVLPHEPPSSEL